MSDWLLNNVKYDTAELNICNKRICNFRDGSLLNKVWYNNNNYLKYLMIVITVFISSLYINSLILLRNIEEYFKIHHITYFNGWRMNTEFIKNLWKHRSVSIGRLLFRNCFSFQEIFDLKYALDTLYSF